MVILAGTWWYWASICWYCLVLGGTGSAQGFYACIYQSQQNLYFPSLPSLPSPKHRLRRLPHQREGQKTEEQGPGTCRRRARPGRELTSLPSGRAGTGRLGETTLTFVRKKKPFQSSGCGLILSKDFYLISNILGLRRKLFGLLQNS